MFKDFLYAERDSDDPMEYVMSFMQLHGEDFWKDMDNSEFMLNFGISRDEFLYHYFPANSQIDNSKVPDVGKHTPFTQDGLEKMMVDFREETVRYLSAPKITEEKVINKAKIAASRENRTSVRPSELRKNKGEKEGAEKAAPQERQKPKPASPRPSPYPATAPKSGNSNQNTVRKEFSDFKKSLLRRAGGSIGRRAINLREKALKKAVAEAGIKWGSHEWVELVEEFFPGAGFNPIIDTVTDSNKNKEETQQDAPAKQNEETTVATQTSEKPQEEMPAEQSASSENSNAQLETVGLTEEISSPEIQQEMVDPSQQSTHTEGEDFVEGVKDEKPTGFGVATKNSAKPLAGSQESKVNSIADKIPELDTPTGLEPNEATPKEDNAAAIDSLNASPETNADSITQIQNQPLGEQLITPTSIPQGNVVDDTFGGVSDDEAAEVIEQKIENLPVSDTTINTNPGAPPDVPLSGEADPQQAEASKQQAEQETKAQKQSADQAASVEIRTQNITPPVDEEILTTELSELGPPPVIGAEIELPTEVPAEIQASFDLNAQTHLEEQASEEYANHDQAIADLETDSEAERQAKLDEIDAETEKTCQEQIAAQAEAQSETDKYKEEWKAENDAVIDEFKASAEEEYDRTRQDIDTKVEEANKENQQIFATAEANAQAEQQKAEVKAEEKKEEATTKKKGFWETVTGAIGDFFDKVKEGLNAIFDAMRKLVKDIIDKAKKLAATVIDLARDFIVSAIKFFGEALKTFVNIAFAAFPELAQKFNNLIDKAVDFAVEKVNQLAEGLKQVVNALLDLLGEVLDKILAAYQAVLNAILDVLEFIAVGIIKILQGLANLGIALFKAVMDYFMGAMVEEALGTDVTQPIQYERTDAEIAAHKNGQQPPADGGGEEPGGQRDDEQQQNEALLSKSELSESDIELPEGEGEISPGLLREIGPINIGQSIPLGTNADPITTEQLQAAFASGGDNVDGIADSIAGSIATDHAEQQAGTEVLAEQDDPDWANMNDEDKLQYYIDQMDAEPAAPEGAQTGEGEGEQEANTESTGISYIAKTNRLSVGRRISFVGQQMMKGMSMWWKKNQVKVYAAIIGILIGAGVIAFFTGGAGLIAVLQVLMQIMTAYFIADAIMRIKDHFYAYLEKAWGGDVEDGGKSLARALAILVSEFVLEYLLKVVGKVLKKIKALLKGGKKVGRAVRKVTRVVRKVVRKVKDIGRRAKEFILKKGKLLFAKLNKAWMKVINSIGDLRQKILKKFGFKRIWAEKHGKYIEIWAMFNPKKRLAKFDPDADDAAKQGSKTALPTTKSSKFGGKIADKIPTKGVPKNWNKADIADAISDYKMSIGTRKEELLDFMKNGKGDAIGHKLHTQRITQEENFLKSLEKAYKSR